MRMKKEDVADALRTFIKSGSANGREDMRRYCLRTVPVFTAAPELLDALRVLVESCTPELPNHTQDVRVPNWNKVEAARKLIASLAKAI